MFGNQCQLFPTKGTFVMKWYCFYMQPVSIVSYNHLGNNDGKNLSAPKQFRSKEVSSVGGVLWQVCRPWAGSHKLINSITTMLFLWICSMDVVTWGVSTFESPHNSIPHKDLIIAAQVSVNLHYGPWTGPWTRTYLLKSPRTVERLNVMSVQLVYSNSAELNLN